MVEWMTVEVSDLDNRFMETDLMETDPYLIINIGILVYKQNGHVRPPISINGYRLIGDSDITAK